MISRSLTMENVIDEERRKTRVRAIKEVHKSEKLALFSFIIVCRYGFDSSMILFFVGVLARIIEDL